MALTHIGLFRPYTHRAVSQKRRCDLSAHLKEPYNIRTLLQKKSPWSEAGVEKETMQEKEREDAREKDRHRHGHRRAEGQRESQAERLRYGEME